MVLPVEPPLLVSHSQRMESLPTEGLDSELVVGILS